MAVGGESGGDDVFLFDAEVQEVGAVLDVPDGGGGPRA